MTTRQRLSPLAREYVDTIVDGIRESFAYGGAPQAFERANCSCAPARKRIEELQAEKDKATASVRRRMQALQTQLETIETPFVTEINELTREVHARDRTEHPQIERNFRVAVRTWVRFWVLEGLESERFAEHSASALPDLFVQDLMAGWQPQPPAMADA